MRPWAGAALAVALVAGSCSDGSHAPGRHLVVTSPAFADGASIPVRFTCDGADVAPVVEWSGASNSGDMVLEMTDTDAHAFVHWLAYGFGGASGRVGGTLHLGEEGRNDFGTNGYRGPCPPHGDDPHRYVITLYEFDPGPSPVEEGEGPADVLNGEPIAEGSLTGTYARA